MRVKRIVIFFYCLIFFFFFFLNLAVIKFLCEHLFFSVQINRVYTRCKGIARIASFEGHMPPYEYCANWVKFLCSEIYRQTR